MQTTRLREQGIWLRRKHSLVGNTEMQNTRFRGHMGWIHNATQVHMNFSAHVPFPIKIRKPFL
jgi:hypothetical protein